MDLNTYGYAGLIMLIGTVKKTRLARIVDFAIDAQHQGKNLYDAIHQGRRLRFRLIMMTNIKPVPR